MRGIERYLKPASIDEALAAKAADASASWLAGGTYLLAGDNRDKPASVIDVGAVLPRGIRREAAREAARESALEAAPVGKAEGGRTIEILTIGAGTTLQELADAGLPPILRDAVQCMADRNIRNRATVGGNLGARKPCSSLIPPLLALDAEVELAGRFPAFRPLRAWLDSRSEDPVSGNAELVLGVRARVDPSRRAAYLRWARVSCDLALIAAALSFEFAQGRIRGLMIALGGLSPRARRFPELEALFEGALLPGREEIEAAAAPLLDPIDDLRASAGFKRLRAAALLADAMHVAAGLLDPVLVAEPPSLRARKKGTRP